MTLVAALTFGIWIYLFFFRGGYWRVSKNLGPAQTLRNSSARVIAVVPARDEADVIGRCVTSLLRQSHPLQVVVVDDGSTDRTAEVARSGAEAAGAGNRLTVLRGEPLPAEWSGKLWALSQGLKFAERSKPDYLLFTDADIEHSSINVQQLLTIAENGGYDLASFMVKLECRTIAERALIPAFVYFFFQLYPPGWIRSRDHATAGAAGGCILLRPEALARSGGIESMRNAVIDDCTLAAQVKRAGGKVWLGLTQSAQSTRSYGSFREVMDMIARTAFNQLQHSGILLAATLAVLIVTYVCPPLLALALGGWPKLLAFGAWLLMSISYLPIVLFYRRSPVWILVLPAIGVFYGAATVMSAIRYWNGRGGLWKGRIQDLRR